MPSKCIKTGKFVNYFNILKVEMLSMRQEKRNKKVSKGMENNSLCHFSSCKFCN